MGVEVAPLIRGGGGGPPGHIGGGGGAPGGLGNFPPGGGGGGGGPRPDEKRCHQEAVVEVVDRPHLVQLVAVGVLHY